MDETQATATSEAMPAEAPATPEPQAETPQGPDAGDALREFGEMDAEAQQQALIDMGLVGPDEEDAGKGEEKPEEKPAEAPAQAQETPAFYTAEELGSTPLERIDEARLPEAARAYWPVVRRNFEALARQNAELVQRLQQAQAARQAPAQGPARPEQARQEGANYKELAAEAVRLTWERLGLKADEELDLSYEPEHAAAFQMAMQELVLRRQGEAEERRQAEQRRGAEERDFGAYAAEMRGRQDFADFDRWVTERLAKGGMRPEQLGEYIRQTGDYAGARRALDTWYLMYQRSRTAAPQPQPPQPRPRAPKPPVVEGAGGAAPGARRAVDLRAFGAMDPDAQARALIDMGLVESF